jgi:SH3-like domain-containing protein
MFQSYHLTRFIIYFYIISSLALLSAPSFAQYRSSGLPLPRFVSLRANEVNMRTGPGVQYPVEWVFKRDGLPVEIISEYDTWRKVRDWQGSQGWIHQSMLNGKRKFIVTGSERTVRRSASSDSAARAILELGVIGKFTECARSSSWCKIEVDNITGWLRRVDVWGIYRDEEIK